MCTGSEGGRLHGVQRGLGRNPPADTSVVESSRQNWGKTTVCELLPASFCHWRLSKRIHLLTKPSFLAGSCCVLRLSRTETRDPLPGWASIHMCPRDPRDKH